jgi:hypothetical protein
VSRAFSWICVGLAALAVWGALYWIVRSDLWLCACLVLAALFFVFAPALDRWSAEAPAVDESPSSSAEPFPIVAELSAVGSATHKREAA